jgi:hypothetical protein
MSDQQFSPPSSRVPGTEETLHILKQVKTLQPRAHTHHPGQYVPLPEVPGTQEHMRAECPEDVVVPQAFEGGARA